MKYIKQFEKLGYYGKDADDLDIGDYVILLKHSKDTKIEKLIVGNIYHITLVDYGSARPYEIGELSNDYGVFVRESQIRKATTSEIAANKYNI